MAESIHSTLIKFDRQFMLEPSRFKAQGLSASPSTYLNYSKFVVHVQSSLRRDCRSRDTTLLADTDIGFSFADSRQMQTQSYRSRTVAWLATTGR